MAIDNKKSMQEKVENNSIYSHLESGNVNICQICIRMGYHLVLANEFVACIYREL